jgi:DNA modification methylase
MPNRKTLEQNERIPIDALQPDPQNPRRRTDRSADLIRASLTQFGGMRSLVVDENNVVRAGNGTLQEAKELGYTSVKIIDTDGTELIAVRRSGLKNDEWIQYGVADNRTSDLSEWDAEILLQLDEEYNLGDWFTPDEIEEFELRLDDDEGTTGTTSILTPRDAQIDEGNLNDILKDLGAKKLPCRVKPGEIWQLGRHKLLCGDSTNLEAVAQLMDGQLAHCCWTDPPYGVNYTGKSLEQLEIENDTPADLGTFLNQAFRGIDSACREGAAIYIAHPDGELKTIFAQAFVHQGWKFHQTLIWVKQQFVLGHSDYHYQHEPINFGYKPIPKGRLGRGGQGWYGDNAQTSIFQVDRPNASKLHPTIKPPGLIVQMLANSTPVKGIIYEPFGGSGSTLIAAEGMGGDRSVRAIELSPDYCTVILHRWEKFAKQEAELLTTI